MVPCVWIGPLRSSHIAADPRRASKPSATRSAWSPPELGQHVPPVPSRSHDAKNASGGPLGNGSGRAAREVDALHEVVERDPPAPRPVDRVEPGPVGIGQPENPSFSAPPRSGPERGPQPRSYEARAVSDSELGGAGERPEAERDATCTVERARPAASERPAAWKPDRAVK